MAIHRGRVGERLSAHFNLKLTVKDIIWVREFAEQQGIPQAQVLRNGIKLLQDKHQ